MRRAFMVSVVAVTAFLSACGGGSQSTSSAPPVLQSLQVSGASNQLTVGQTQQMKATGAYSTGSSQDVTSSATWASSDNTVATVTAGALLVDP